MHGGVVGCYYDDAAVDAGHGAVDEGVGAYVHSDVFHANHGSFAGVGHAERGFHGGFLVGAPSAVDVVVASDVGVLYEFGNFG